MPAVITASAACNNMWISCPNSSAPESMWPGFFVRSDGITTGRLERNIPGVLLSVVDTGQDLYDSTGRWRHQAIAGTWHSGQIANDATRHPRDPSVTGPPFTFNNSHFP